MAGLTSGVGTISSAGIGSGLDVNNIVTQLMAVERQPLGRLQSTATSLETKLSAFGQMQSLVSGMQDATKPLYAAASYGLSNTSSTDATSVSATTTATAPMGSYTVSVNSLVAAQSIVSPTGQYANADAAVGTGSFTIRLGSWNAANTAFTPKTGSADMVVTIGAADNTLAKVRDKINAANAGVTASIVTDSTGARLALQSTTPGQDNGFRIIVDDDDADVKPKDPARNYDAIGLSRLTYDPGGVGAQMTRAQSASDTEVTVNGISFRSATNTISGAVEGITFTASKVTTSPVTVSVTRDTASIKTMVEKFVSSYNALNTFLSSTTRYDVATKQAALLQGDGTTTSLYNQLRSLVSPSSTASATFKTLSSIGVQLQKDGSLKLDEKVFADAVANLPELTKALSHVDVANPKAHGFGKRFAAWADGILATGGTLPGKTKSLQARIASNRREQDAMSDRLEMTEKRLRAQYSALDTAMAKANALSKYVQQQFYSKSSYDDRD